MEMILHILASSLASTPAFRDCMLIGEVCPNPNITFRLFDSNSSERGVAIDYGHLKPELFPVRKPLVVLLHGFSKDMNDPLNMDNRLELLKHENVYVLSVDYGPLVRFPCYTHSVLNVNPIGKCISKLLELLVERHFFEANDIHVIGFSLGAHVAGAVGQFFRNGKLGRITGLDPAKPLFNVLNSSYKLDKGDAEFVDVIHTATLTRGMLEPTGHVDFFPNGGETQPGCELEFDPGHCSHERATKYFSESIRAKFGFEGTHCDTLVDVATRSCQRNKNDGIKQWMGYHTNQSARGSYYVITNSKAPFARA